MLYLARLKLHRSRVYDVNVGVLFPLAALEYSMETNNFSSRCFANPVTEAPADLDCRCDMAAPVFDPARWPQRNFFDNQSSHMDTPRALESPCLSTARGLHTMYAELAE